MYELEFKLRIKYNICKQNNSEHFTGKFPFYMNHCTFRFKNGCSLSERGLGAGIFFFLVG